MTATSRYYYGYVPKVMASPSPFTGLQFIKPSNFRIFTATRSRPGLISTCDSPVKPGNIIMQGDSSSQFSSIQSNATSPPSDSLETYSTLKAKCQVSSVEYVYMVMYIDLDDVGKCKVWVNG
uniref:Uncharacterized protein n=1 Tax=Glossina pallidipes TaxID=7398 RepID=A0A1B0A7K1_GLOPL